MSSPLPGSPQQGTGLPPGVEVGPLGPRFVAYLIDSLVPVVLGVVLGLVRPNLSGTPATVITLVFVLAIVGWIFVVWRGIATRAASPGMGVMRLQLVGFYDGRPIGWGRTIARGLLFWVLGATVVGFVIMLILLVLHPRKQGWHDLVAKAVVIKQRGLPPSKPPAQAGIAAQSAPPQQYGPPPDQGQQQYDQGQYPQPQYAPQPVPEPSQPSQPPYGQPTPSYVEPSQAAYGPQSRYPQSPYSQPSAPPVPAAPASQPPPARAPEPTPPAVPRWLAELDDGREIAVDGLVLLGRNPQPQPGEEDAQLIKVADETRTVSKSHLAIGLDSAGLFVVDRGSTNGSTVTTPEGVSTRCQPGEIVYVEAESIVSIGDHWLRIRQTSA